MIWTMLLLTVSAATPAVDPILLDYAQTVEGSFTTASQAAADERYDVAEAEVVRIWPERSDGIWLYQEQAIVDGAGAAPGASKEKPYFQRVSHVQRLADGRLRRDNYVLRSPGRFVGLGRRPGVAHPRQDDLGIAGCHNIVERVARGYFIARTEDCANGYKGATMMKSVSMSTPSHYVNWDRGFDAAGERVWGPEEGGYVFEKVRR